jgi:NACHT domain
MTRQTHPQAGRATAAFVSWLVTGAVGPALVALPVGLAADKLAAAAVGWFKRYRQTDDLSRLVKAAAGTSVQLSRAEVGCLRELLKQEQTWSLLAGGKLAANLPELHGKIAACLPPRDGRTPEDAHAAAEAITRGLVEFAVCELQPEIFQKVVLARLQQMSDQASALDQALFRMHEDLYYLVSAASEAKARFRLVSDRLPLARAGLSEVKLYLETLIGWLNTDPWPQDQRLRGPVLTPAVIERKLHVTPELPSGKQDADADDLARRCTRLVILGGPGSGKTWLARRTARRCAEDALQALADGATVDEVELPLYTTCSGLVSAPGDIRRAAASSALDDAADLGGSRIKDALVLLFTERGNATLLVIDSLDEAHDPGDRLAQAGTLPWRIVVTSRPSAWNHQLSLENGSQAHQVGDLQPLRYPADVAAVIRQWFADRPDQGQELFSQIGRRPYLQQAATVPLILAFYCILGSEPLPEFRRELYDRVINRLLTSTWHGLASRSPDLDVAACLSTLRSWAWAGAASDPVSGIRTWQDEIPAEPVRLGDAEREALDHIATPVSLPHPDTHKTLRRFVHRSIQEHLAAQHVAGLPAGEAVTALLPHLWYEPDWEYTAPAAIAMHEEHGEVLRGLLCHASGSDELPGDLAAIDAGGQLSKLLARVATESRQDAWPAELATIIGRARVTLAESGFVDDLGETGHWPDSNRAARDVLFELLARSTDFWEAANLATGIAQLATTEKEQRLARQALLGRIADPSHSRVAAGLARGLARLNPTPKERRGAREVLLHLLAGRPSGTPAVQLIEGLEALGPAPKDRRQARAALLRLLADPSSYRLVALSEPLKLAQLGATGPERRQAREALLARLARQDARWTASFETTGLARLGPTPKDRRQARAALVELLVRPEPVPVDRWSPRRALIEVTTTESDRRQTRRLLLRSLADPAHAKVAVNLAGCLADLDPEPKERRQALNILLALLARPAETRLARLMTEAIVQLATDAQDKRQARPVLLGLLARRSHSRVAAQLGSGLARLDPDDQERTQARQVLLDLLVRLAENWMTAQLPGRKGWPAVTDADARQVSDALSQLMDGTAWQPVSRELDLMTASDLGLYQPMLRLIALKAPEEGADLAAALAELHPTERDRARARKAVLGLLADQPHGEAAARLAGSLAQLGPTPKDVRRAREVLLTLLPAAMGGRASTDPASTIVPGMVQAIDVQVSELTGWLSGAVAEMVTVLLQLDPTPDCKREIRGALLGLLARDTDRGAAAALIRLVAQLDPTVGDLAGWRAWAAPPTGELLAAVRQNTELGAWLTALPALSR